MGSCLHFLKFNQYLVIFKGKFIFFFRNLWPSSRGLFVCCVAKNPEGSKWIGVDEKYATKGENENNQTFYSSDGRSWMRRIRCDF